MKKSAEELVYLVMRLIYLFRGFFLENRKIWQK